MFAISTVPTIAHAAPSPIGHDIIVVIGHATMRDATNTMAVDNLRDRLKEAANSLDKGSQGDKGLEQALRQAESLRQQLPAEAAFSFEQRVLVGALADIRPAVFVTPGLFIDIGVPEDFARAQHHFAAEGTS